MKWKFWQKEAFVKVAPKRLAVPAEKIRRLRRLSDELGARPDGQDNEAKFLLWEAIAEIFPETREGLWKMESPTALRIEIVERIQAK